MKTKKRHKVKRIIIGIVVFLAAVTAAFLIYAYDYYNAEETAVEAASLSSGITITKNGSTLIFDPGNADTALVFYPGGKVEYTAYEPLMTKIAGKGILCILPEMPFNLAVFDLNAASAYIEEFPDIKHWYVGGHSLGGSMAASFASKNTGKVEGLVLLASYSTADLSQTDVKVLSIFGSFDGVLNSESYEKYRRRLPQDFTEQIIEGGNHSGFGCYGQQKGDGEASISADEQQTETADYISGFCLK